MRKEAVPKSARARVTTELKKVDRKFETNKEVPVDIDVPMGKEAGSQLCNVGFSVQRTINLGNYENVKLGVYLSVPCSQTAIDTTFKLAKDWVEDRMERLENRYSK